MEDLLTPQICMDVDETPLDMGKDTSDDEAQSDDNSKMDDDEKVKSCSNVKTGNPTDTSFITVPINPTIRQYWLSAVGLDKDCMPAPLVCCESHFDMENDVRNWSYFKIMGGKIFIKPGVVPHKNIGQNPFKEEENIESTITERQKSDNQLCEELLDYNFSDPSQVPDELTDFEKDAKKNVFCPGELAVQFHRLHCTACNVHLGSAPIAFFDRYIHPLLKVLMCKSCYNFYCSGEFDKDEDGSEMYCRWCGQGGKVMCCAQCAYVFCQKCVRQNLGKKTLEIIKDSDDWMCFGCNPSQLINLKIICTSLYDFTQEEIRLSKALMNVERLKIDHSMCCTKAKPSAKRRRDEDETYTPFTDEVKLVKKGKIVAKCKPTEPLKAKTWPTQKEDGGEEVVCAPDVLSLVDEEHTDSKTVTPLAANKENKIDLSPLLVQRKPIFTTLAPKPLYICSAGNLSKPPNNSFTNIVRIQTPAIKLVTPTNPTTTTVPLVTSIPVQLVPGLKHDWFEKAATVVSTITGNLSFTLDTLTSELKETKTVENLATVHNKLQELLSTSINSLIQVRKSLRNQFLTDLNNLKFTTERNAAANVLPPILPKDNSDDDDVVIVKSDILPKREPVKNNNGRPYLKVRTVSQLLTVPAECITIPDDPPDILGGLQEKSEKIPEKEREAEIKELENTDCTIEIETSETKNENKSVEKLEDSSKNQENGKIENNEINSDKENNKLDNDDQHENSEKEQDKVELPDDANINDLSGYDNETSILIKNALTESKLDQIIDENLKLITDFSEDELRKMLSVRVVAASGSKPDLPSHRLKNNEWFAGDIEEQLDYSILPNILCDKPVEETTETSSNHTPPLSPVHNDPEEISENIEENRDSVTQSDVEMCDTICNTSEEGKVEKETSEDITESHCDNQNEPNDSVLDEITKSLSANESNFSENETVDQKTDDDEKSLSDNKQMDSENSVSDLASNTQADDLRTETFNDPITDSGVEVDNK